MNRADPAASSVLDRVLVLEMVRVTEAAAIAASKWIGRGDNDAADAAAVEAMRMALNELPFCGTVVIGEGERDEAPMLYIGERVGCAQESGPGIDIALDPLEGTTLTANAGPNALAVLAIAEEGCLLNAPDTYMEKLAIGPGYPEGTIDLRKSPADNVRAIAAAKGVQPGEIIACVLDRPRHEKIIAQLREIGCGIKLIPDGDVAGVIATADPDTGIDVYMIVPSAHKGPSGARILQVGIGEKAFPHCAISLERRREMVGADFQRVRNARDFIEFPVEAGLSFPWILHDLVDEIAKVQDEIELVLGLRPLILEDHTAVAVELAFVDILAANEREIDRTGVVSVWRRFRAADAAAVPFGIGEAVPIDVGGLQLADEHPRGPVRSRRHRRGSSRDHVSKRLIFGDFDDQDLTASALIRAPRPQDHAVRVGIARSNAFGIVLPVFTPVRAGGMYPSAPCQAGAHRRR